MSFTSKKIPFDLNNPKDIKISLDSVLFFSSLHFGDNDTTGAIAGAWYGALYGFSQFDENKLNQLEFNKDQLELMKFYIDRYNAIMAGQANGDEHRMFEKAEKIAKDAVA